jgi:hypothetical protein
LENQLVSCMEEREALHQQLMEQEEDHLVDWLEHGVMLCKERKIFEKQVGSCTRNLHDIARR